MSTAQFLAVNMCVISFFTLSCKPPQVQDGKDDSQSQHIIGNNDVMPLTVPLGEDHVYHKFLTGINASVLLSLTAPGSLTTRYCSGFVFEKHDSYIKVLTNHHCFAIKSEDTGLSTDKLVTNACENTKVYFNVVRGMESAITHGACVPGSLITNAHADIAVFAVSGDIPPNAQPIRIINEKMIDGGVINKPAYMIHFPLSSEDNAIDAEYVTPAPELNVARLPAARITSENCKISGEYDRKQQDNINVLYFSFKHTCDLTEGSSGSPLISQETHNLIGLNWGGVKTRVGDGEPELSNSAIKPSHIIEFLEEDPDLDERIQSLLNSKSLVARNGGKKDDSDDFFNKLAAGCAAITAQHVGIAGGPNRSSDDANRVWLALLWLSLGLMLPQLQRRLTV